MFFHHFQPCVHWSKYTTMSSQSLTKHFYILLEWQKYFCLKNCHVTTLYFLLSFYLNYFLFLHPWESVVRSFLVFSNLLWRNNICYLVTMQIWAVFKLGKANYRIFRATLLDWWKITIFIWGLVSRLVKKLVEIIIFSIFCTEKLKKCKKVTNLVQNLAKKRFFLVCTKMLVDCFIPPKFEKIRFEGILNLTKIFGSS